MSYEAYNRRYRVELDPYTGMPVHENQPKDPKESIHPMALRYVPLEHKAASYEGYLRTHVTELNCRDESQMIKQWGCWIGEHRIDPINIDAVHWIKQEMWITWRVQ